MKKPLIFGGGNHLKILSLILFVTFLTLSCSAESTPKAEFSLTKVPDTVPTEDVWVIDSIAAPAEADFNKLQIALKTAETENRKIRLVFPNIVKIPDNAVDGIKSIVFFSANKATTIGSSAFLNCPALTTVSLPLVTIIGNNAFLNCDSLTTVNLPLATTIGSGAFESCSSLTTVSLPKAETIGSQAFADCDSLTTVSLPKAETIGNNAFLRCDSLTTVSLPLVTTIENNAFAQCSALTTMTIATKSASLTLDPNVFFDVVTAKITVTTSTANAGKFKGFKKVIGI